MPYVHGYVRGDKDVDPQRLFFSVFDCADCAADHHFGNFACENSDTLVGLVYKQKQARLRIN